MRIAESRWVTRISVAPESEVEVMRGWYTVNTRWWSVVVLESGVVGVEVVVGVRVGVGVGVRDRKWCVSSCVVGG